MNTWQTKRQNRVRLLAAAIQNRTIINTTRLAMTNINTMLKSRTTRSEIEDMRMEADGKNVEKISATTAMGGSPPALKTIDTTHKSMASHTERLRVKDDV